MLMRGANEGNVLENVLYRQQTIAGLLNADISAALCAKKVVSKQDKFFIKQTRGSANAGESWKVCDRHRAFLGFGENLNLPSLSDDQGRGWLANKGGRLERFIGKGSLLLCLHILIFCKKVRFKLVIFC